MSESSRIVYILEFPSPTDFLSGIQEGDLLEKSLSIAEIPVFSWKIVNKTCLEQVIAELSQICKTDPHYPILHFSGHGNKNGIRLTDGNFISWQDLRKIIQPLADTIDGKLLVCLSTCEGVSAMQMCFDAGKEVFESVVGPKNEVTWADAAIAFSTLYHLFLHKQIPLGEAVSRMNLASGQEEAVFISMSGKLLKAIHTKVVAKRIVDRIRMLPKVNPKPIVLPSRT